MNIQNNQKPSKSRLKKIQEKLRKGITVYKGVKIEKP